MQNTQDIPIPANRLPWYANEREGANWAGVSLLRPCYSAWVLKHETMRVHATAIRRFGMGVPVVAAPPGEPPRRSSRPASSPRGCASGTPPAPGCPAGFKFTLTGLSGWPPDAVAFLAFLNQEMTGSALTQIVELGHTAHGSRAVGDTVPGPVPAHPQAAADAIGDTATSGTRPCPASGPVAGGVQLG